MQDTWTDMGDGFGGMNESNDFRKKDLELIVGLALRKVPSVLGLKPSLTDIFKKGDDWSKGISVSADENTMAVSARVIADSAYDPADVIAEASAAIAESAEAETFKMPCEVEVKIVESMTPAQFLEKYPDDILN